MGAQIDLLISRDDNIVDLVEAKFAPDFYSCDSSDQIALNRKGSAIEPFMPKRYSVQYVLTTTYGLSEGSYDSIFDNVITLDDLFQ